jgi:hypothetical protein
MSISSRNFNTLDISRARSVSGPVSDLPERILLKLETSAPNSEEELVTSIEGEVADVRSLVRTMINLKLIQISGNTKPELSQFGRTALQSKFLSIAGGD